MLTFPAEASSRRLISPALAVILVPPSCKVVALSSPAAPYTAALLFTIVPAVDPLRRFNSSAPVVTATAFILRDATLTSPLAP